MIDAICLNENYSTTKLLTKEKPVVENRPEDKFETILFLPKGENRKGEGGLRTNGYSKKSYEGKPLVSIITVVFNGEKYLEQTIQSVIDQAYDNVEYIIVDGGSTDGTVDIIKKYEDRIDYWVSEKDAGIYDAMNKGISLAQGKIIGLINADDYYESEVFHRVAKVYIGSTFDVLYGDTAYIKEDRKIIISAHNVGKKYNIFPYSLNWIWVKMLFGHPSSFISMKTYKKYGLYDLSFKIVADYDLFIRLVIHKLRFNYIPGVIGNFREGGISTTDTQLLEEENFRARKNNNFFIAYSIHMLLMVLHLIKRIKKGKI